MRLSENRCVCCGAVIPEGRQVCKRCEWPETVTNYLMDKEHPNGKTADEMFREHGYRLETSELPYPYYTNEGGEHIEVCVHGRCRIAKYENVYGYGVRFLPLDAEEILACAQLIREMGCVDGN